VSPATVHLGFDTVLKGLNLPVSLATDGSHDGRLYISELNGIVRVYQDGHLTDRPFLDLSGEVTALRGEDGFYGIAFHPGFPRDPRFYAAYTKVGSDDLQVVEFRALPSLAGADPSYRRQVLQVTVDQPFHHGGQVAFGPDGDLYISTGDGQEANHWLHEPPFLSQRLDRLQGKVLRIDVDHGSPYTIPKDNPFVGRKGARGEIWALGFRNPWKFTFDPATGALLLSDVGNDRWEEIDRVVKGGNYGWPIREGPECQAFPDVPGLVDPHCADLPLRAPAAAYGHPSLDPQGGDAVVGGVVYRGNQTPEIANAYLYADFCTGELWAFPADGSTTPTIVATGLGNVAAFGTDPAGEVYVLRFGQPIVRLTSP